MVNPSDHFDGKRFHNPNPKKVDKRGLWEVLKWKLWERAKPWPKAVENTHTPQLGFNINEKQAYITFINHLTELIQIKALNLLTDPVFSKRTSPFTWLGPKRIRPPGMPLIDLPKIDIVLISHNHYDHMDLASLQKIMTKDDPLFIVPLNNAALLQNAGIKK